MSSSASAAGILAEQSQRGPAVEVDTALIGSEPDPLAEIGARAVEILRRKPDEATAFPSAGIVRRQPDRLAIVGAGAAHFVHIAQRVATIEQRADVVRLGFEFFAVIGDRVGLVALAMIDDATRTVDAGPAATSWLPCSRQWRDLTGGDSSPHRLGQSRRPAGWD